jgi:hypothetical protein
MAKKKQPYHIVHKFKQFELSDGTNFWAEHNANAKLYIKKVEGK